MNKKDFLDTSNGSVNKDYILALGSAINFIESIEDGEPSRTRHLAKRSFLHREIPHYEVYFGDERFSDVVNDENRAVVKEINSIVDTINSCRLKGVVDYDVIQPLVLRIINLIG